MANSAQANSNAVRVIYGSDDATIPMKDQEITCLFQWIQFLDKHTKANIYANHQDQHRKLYKQYKNATTYVESKTCNLAI
jgi:hypothetical protein